MRFGDLLRNTGSGLDRFSVILVLLAYVFAGGLSGFGPRGGHSLLETTHLPNSSRDTAVSDPSGSGFVLHGDHGFSAKSSGAQYQTAGSAPPQTDQDLAPINLVRLYNIIVLILLGDTQHSGSLAEAQTVAIANPAWWLRTVVLHL